MASNSLGNVLGSSESDFKAAAEGLIRQYFTHGSLADVEDSLLELLGRAQWNHQDSWQGLADTARHVGGGR